MKRVHAGLVRAGATAHACCNSDCHNAAGCACQLSYLCSSRAATFPPMKHGPQVPACKLCTPAGTCLPPYCSVQSSVPCVHTADGQPHSTLLFEYFSLRSTQHSTRLSPVCCQVKLGESKEEPAGDGSLLVTAEILATVQQRRPMHLLVREKVCFQDWTSVTYGLWYC